MIISKHEGKKNKGFYYKCKCDNCEKDFSRAVSNVGSSKHQFCNRGCSDKYKVGRTSSKATRKKMSDAKKGKKPGNWKGGWRITNKGYKVVLKPRHPNANGHGYVAEHRLAMEKHLDRYLEPEEVVHHINEIRADNRIENLMLFESPGQHAKHHIKKKINRGKE